MRSRVPLLAHSWPVACDAILVIAPPRPVNFAVVIVSVRVLAQRWSTVSGCRALQWEWSLGCGATSAVARYCNSPGLGRYYGVAVLGSACSCPDLSFAIGQRQGFASLTKRLSPRAAALFGQRGPTTRRVSPLRGGRGPCGLV